MEQGIQIGTVLQMDKIDLMLTQYPDVWKTRSAVFTWIKGIIRRGWNTAPQKLILIKKLRKQIPNPNPKGKKPTVWGAECQICNQLHVLSNMQVDHKDGETAKLTELQNIQSCTEKLLCVLEEDLRLICKGCHSTHSLSQRLHITFEAAKLEQRVIEFKKLKATDQTIALAAQGITSTIKTAALRVMAYRDVLKMKGNNEV